MKRCLADPVKGVAVTAKNILIALGIIAACALVIFAAGIVGWWIRGASTWGVM